MVKLKTLVKYFTDRRRILSGRLCEGKLMKLNYSHISMCWSAWIKNTTKVRNIKQYLLAALFNAPSTIGSYYKNRGKSRHATVRKLKEVLMIVLRMAGKNFIVTGVVIISHCHLLVKIAVEIYCIGKRPYQSDSGFYADWNTALVQTMGAGVFYLQLLVASCCSFCGLECLWKLYWNQHNTKLEN